MADPIQAVRVIGAAGVPLFALLGVAMSDRSLAVAAACAAGVSVISILAARSGITDWPLAIVLGAAVALLVVIGDGTSQCLSWMGLCVIAGWVTLISRTTVAVATGAALVAVLAMQWIGETSEPGWAAWSFGTVFTVVACAFSRRLRLTVLELRSAQQELADRTRAEERARIAAEVHDVIGHALTVSLLHIGSAKLALDEDRAEAQRALEEAERLSRRSLEEVRATVGLMRSDHSGETGPLPGASAIPELVESFRAAGAAVDLVVDGSLDAIGQTRGLAAYRMVQESLTNATRHAPGSPVQVQVHAGEDAVVVTVTNPVAQPVGTPTAGSGLRGMRERATSVGGSLEAGPYAAGWRVRAELPS